MAAPTELAPAPGASAPPPVPAAPERSAGPREQRALEAVRAHLSERQWWLTLLVGAVFCWIAFHAKGGLNLQSMTSTEMALTLVTGVLVAVSIVHAPVRMAYGLWPAGLMLAFAVLTTLSIVWSVQPESSWQDSGRMLAYTGVFAAGVALAQVAPRRWPAILGGLTLASAVVCGYALLTKVFPGSLDPSNAFARVNEPYGYWNAVGLSAALGVVCCLWLGARRSGHALLSALAYPAMALQLTTLVLAYSRGALAALALGVVLWLCMVPLRLRSAALLLVGGLGAGVMVAWDFSQHALSSEGISIAERTSAGHELGALAVAVLAALTLAGIAIGFLSAKRPPSLLTRRRAGLLLLAGVALALILFAGALAHSQRGFTGTISHGFHSLTDPNAKPPPNTPGRLTAVASERARYWKEALQVFSAHPALGAGAEGFATAHLRYEAQTLEVRHAHGFIVQTLADLGLVGLLVVLALLFCWMAAAGRATHPFNRRFTPWRTWRGLRSGARPGWRALSDGALTRYTPERIGLLAMLCLVVTFGAHSFVDWTWYVPGDACVALLCAGWLAGRGPLVGEPARDLADTRPPGPASDPTDARRPGPASDLRARLRGAGHTRVAWAAAALLVALLAAWSQWQPQRSEVARQQALGQLASDPHRPTAALAAANSAVARDPLSVEALSTLAVVQKLAGEPRQARETLERAVRLQPSNPQTWLTLGRYELTSDPSAAVRDLQASIYLDPASISAEAIAVGEPEAIKIHNEYVQALEAVARERKPDLRGFQRSRSSARTEPSSAAVIPVSSPALPARR